MKRIEGQIHLILSPGKDTSKVLENRADTFALAELDFETERTGDFGYKQGESNGVENLR